MTRNLTQKNTEPNKKVVLIYPKESYLIRGACFDLYKDLGFGHKEVVYQRGLEVKLKNKGLLLVEKNTYQYLWME